VAPNGLVNRSAIFSFNCTFAILTIVAATASLTLWYAMELCFFFNCDVGVVELVMTDLLSQNTLVLELTGVPSIRSLYLKLSIISTAVFNTTNSEPNVEVSTLF